MSVAFCSPFPCFFLGPGRGCFRADGDGVLPPWGHHRPTSHGAVHQCRRGLHTGLLRKRSLLWTYSNKILLQNWYFLSKSLIHTTRWFSIFLSDQIKFGISKRCKISMGPFWIIWFCLSTDTEARTPAPFLSSVLPGGGAPFSPGVIAPCGSLFSCSNPPNKCAIHLERDFDLPGGGSLFVIIDPSSTTDFKTSKNIQSKNIIKRSVFLFPNKIENWNLITDFHCGFRYLNASHNGNMNPAPNGKPVSCDGWIPNR